MDKKLIYILVPFLIVFLSVNAIVRRVHINFVVIFTLTAIISVLILRFLYKVIKADEGNRSKRILIGIISIVMLIIAISYQPTFNSTAFLIKHIILFLILTSVFTYTAYRVYSKYHLSDTLNRKRVRLIKGFIIAITFVSIGLFSQLHMRFINTYSIPPFYGCSYYDDYGNLIYNSQYEGSCPELVNVKKVESDNGHTLSFSVSEVAFREEETYKENYTIETDISYRYDFKNRITGYEIEVYYKTYYLNDETSDAYRLYMAEYFKKEITNTYQTNEIHSVHKTYSNRLRYEVGETFDQMVLTDVDPITGEYRSILTFVDDTHADITVEYRKLSDEDPVEFDELYNVRYLDDVFEDSGYTYGSKYLMITRAKTDDQIKIERHASSNRIDERYETEGFGLTQQIKGSSFRLNTVFSKPIHTIAETDDYYDDVYGTYVENQQLRLQSSGFYNVTSMVSDEPYGFKLEHYHHERGDWLQFHQYGVADYHLGKKNNHMSVPLEALYVSSYYYSPHYEPLAFIYQPNPMLFEQELLFTDE